MKVLLISPIVFPINEKTRYVGIEKLVWEYSKELSKSNEVTVLAHADSQFPEGITLLPAYPEGNPFSFGELRPYQLYQRLFRTFDIIHDFSHSHFTARFNVSLPVVSIFWHAPAIAQYPKAPYNIIGLSQWACREFRRVYHQEARYQQSIVIDSDVYKPDGQRGDRFLTLGIMSPNKGNLEAIELCRQAGVPLDVAGGRESPNQPLTDYEKAILPRCDGKQIQFWGEVSQENKMKLLQTCRALIYVMPGNYTEVTSHKIQEAMLCGAPVIVPRSGGVPEIIKNGVDGYLCTTGDEYLEAIKNVDKLTPEVTLQDNIKKYSVKEVCAQYTELYSKANGGLRW